VGLFPELTDLFESRREDVWRELARQVGGWYAEGNHWRAEKVEARVKEWTITLDLHRVGLGSNPRIYTRLRAAYADAGDFRFQVHRAGVFSWLGKWLGVQDVVVGHEPFDSDFVIQANDERRVRELLGNARIRELIERQPRLYFGAQPGPAWGEPALPAGVSELRFHVEHAIVELDRLRGLYDLFAETLDELCRQRSARSQNPGAR